MTSHNADYTETYFREGWSVWHDNLQRFRKGEALATPVDIAAGY